MLAPLAVKANLKEVPPKQTNVGEACLEQGDV